MILVYFSNNKPTCHNVTLVKLGKTQTVLFVFPFSYSSCLTIYFFTFQTLLFTYCNSITVIGLLQYSWRPASTCPFNIWNVVLPGKSCSLYCSWFAVFPFFPADIPAAPSVMHLTSLLIFNRKAGRNIHALIHVNASPSPIILFFFFFFILFPVLYNTSWHSKDPPMPKKGLGSISLWVDCIFGYLHFQTNKQKTKTRQPHVKECNPFFFSYWCTSVILN